MGSVRRQILERVYVQVDEPGSVWATVEESQSVRVLNFDLVGLGVQESG